MKPKISSDTNQDQVWATISYTLNLGNFESCKVELGTSRTVTEETAEQTRNELCATLMDEVVEQGKSLKKRIKRLPRKDEND
jgi:hypothetical protein